MDPMREEVRATSSAKKLRRGALLVGALLGAAYLAGSTHPVLGSIVAVNDPTRLSSFVLPLLGARDAGAFQVNAALPARAPARAHAQAALSPAQDPRSTRRDALQQAAAAAVAFAAAPAWAAEPGFSTDKLQPYIDSARGFKLYRPTGWNEFSADPGNYDIKFQDIIEQETQIVVSSSPVVNATSVKAIGDLEAVGQRLAKSRGEEVISAKERTIKLNNDEQALLYTYELKDDKFHNFLILCINRGKLFRVTLSTSNRKWKTLAELYTNVAASFVPQGF